MIQVQLPPFEVVRLGAPGTTRPDIQLRRLYGAHLKVVGVKTSGNTTAPLTFADGRERAVRAERYADDEAPARPQREGASRHARPTPAYVRAELADGTHDPETLRATAKTLQNCAARLKRTADKAAS